MSKYFRLTLTVEDEVFSEKPKFSTDVHCKVESVRAEVVESMIRRLFSELHTEAGVKLGEVDIKEAVSKILEKKS